MLSPKNIKLKDGIHLRLTAKRDGNKMYYLYHDSGSDSYPRTQLSDYFKIPANNQNDFSKTSFVKKSTIPRSKFREYGKTQNWKIVRDKDAATSIVIPNNYFDTDTFWVYGFSIMVDTGLVKDLFNADSDVRKYISANYKFLDASIIKNLETGFFSSQIENRVLDDFSVVEILVNDIDYQVRSAVRQEYAHLVLSGKFLVYHSPTGRIQSEKVELFLNYRNKLTTDSSLASVIGDSVIAKAEFDGVEAMMKSGTEDNISLAVSLVTQCNYSKSILYLALFLFTYNEKVRDTKAYNLKDYKGLRQHFAHYGDVKHWGIHTLAQIIRDHKDKVDDDFKIKADELMSNFVAQKIGTMDEFINIENVTFNYG